jgi:hypothetical protein
MIENLNKCILDLIITTQMNAENTIDYETFPSETIVPIGGNKTESDTFETLNKQGDLDAMELWLKQQKMVRNHRRYEAFKTFSAA